MQPASDSPVERLYHVVVHNDRTGVDIYMTATPATHAEACTIKSKLIPDSRRPAHLRTILKEVPREAEGGTL